MRDESRYRLPMRELLAPRAAPVLSTPPKTESGRRNIPLDAGLVALLKAHRDAQKDEQGKPTDNIVEIRPAIDGYVFTNELGDPHHPDHFGDRFEELVRAAGLPRIRLHDTRHTVCSLMLADGESVKVVQEMAGHSSPATTLNLYTHTTPSMGKAAGEALSASLLG
jgi:integrase